MTNSKYPNGYLPYIAHHMASDNHEVVAHFFERQVVAYGPITAENMIWIMRERDKVIRVRAAEELEFNNHLNITRI